MRIALCLSGHFRAFPMTWDSWETNVIQDHDVDVFCHMWDRIGPAIKSTNPVRDADGVIESELIDISSVRDLCNPVDLVVERYDKKVEAFRKKAAPIYEIVDRLGLSRVNQSTANLSMYYKQWKCNQLKQKHESLHGFKYDAVIRTRFDVQIHNPFSQEMLDNMSKVWTSTNAPGGPMYGEVNDICIVTESRNMDIINNVYPTFDSKLKKYEEAGEPYSVINPHIMLARHITDNGLVLHETPELQVDVVRVAGTKKVNK